MDPLTGINNRRALERKMSDFFEECNAEQLPMSVMVLDIDHFKRINDTYGHQVGDDAIKMVVEAIKPYASTESVSLGRFGGEEFVVAMRGYDSRWAQSTAEVIRSSVEKTPFPITGQNAFRHCAGVHTHAAQVNPLHYQSLDPAPFDRKMDITLDHMSGISSLKYALSQICVEDLNKELLNEVLSRVKHIGRTGRFVELDELAMILHWVTEKEKSEQSTRKVANFES